ncbi:MAG: hypothetical protein KKA60_00690 [Proteobacteria bacterium]|nr:hypothetical protein [Pseudomonadota bacterium]
MMRIHRLRIVTILLFVAAAVGLAALAPQNASAAWWKFGKSDDLPDISDLKFNQVNVNDVEDHLTLGKDDLDQGRVVLRGRATLDQGKVGKVEVSLDGGKTWKKALLGDRGIFSFEFTPVLERPYAFVVRALSTTGKSSDVEDHTFDFTVSSRTNTEAVKAAFFEMIRLYCAENSMGFMNGVSPNFDGNLSALADAVQNDFRAFDNIRIQAFITRIVEFDNNFDVYFTFNRQVMSTRTGQLLKDQLASTCEFTRQGEGYQLYSLSHPLIFGLSDPENVASSGFVTEESVGRSAIVVTKDGQAKEEVLGQTAGQGDSTVQEGSASLVSQGFNNAEGFVFEDDTVVNCQDSPDFCMEFHMLFIPQASGNAIQDLGTRNLDDVREVPETGYSQGLQGETRVGHVYAFRLGNGHYAILSFSELGTEIDPVNQVFRSRFRYKYQTEAGKRTF